MRKVKFLSLAVLLALLSNLLFSTAMAQTLDDEVHIKAIVEQYFQTKYKSQQTLNPQDFSHLVSETARAKTFVQAEKDKREIELHNARLNGLRYIDYDLLLEFKTMQINKDTQTAVVEVIEGHDVVFEATKDVTSSMRNLQHTFTLQKTKDGWKIVEDAYEDELRQLLDSPEVNKEQLIERVNSWHEETTNISRLEVEKQISLNEQSETARSDISEKASLNKQPEAMRTTSFHSYNRIAAVNYAHEWYNKRNPNYGTFDGIGGDCTNFVSQVIHAGGAPMDSTGNYQWYYYGYNDRASSWTGVNQLYSYLVGNTWIGPVGQKMLKWNMKQGDVIQIDLKPDTGYEHSVVVVDAHWVPITWYWWQYRISIAAHDTDRDNYPLSHYSPYGKRYIKIKGYYE